MLKSTFSWKAVPSLDLFHRTISVFALFLGRLYRNLFRVAYLFFYHSNRAILPTRTATLNKVLLTLSSLSFFSGASSFRCLCALLFKSCFRLSSPQRHNFPHFLFSRVSMLSKIIFPALSTIHTFTHP